MSKGNKRLPGEPLKVELSGANQLLIAVEDGDEKKIASLLEQNVSVEPDDLSVKIPLNIAAAGGHLKIVKMLVEAGALVNRLSTSNYKEAYRTQYAGSLAAAVDSGNIDLVEYLLKLTLENANCTPDNQKFSLEPKAVLKAALKIALYKGDVESANHILGTKIIDHKDMNLDYLLICAAIAGKMEMVDFLLARGADVNGFLNINSSRYGLGDNVIPSPIIAAMEQGHEEIALRLLKQPGVKINYHTRTNNGKLWREIANPLFAAIYFKQTEIAEWILDNTKIDLMKINNVIVNQGPQLDQNAFEFAKQHGQTQIAGKIAQKMIINMIANAFLIAPSSLEIKVDHNRNYYYPSPSVYVLFEDEDLAKKTLQAIGNELKKDLSPNKYAVGLNRAKLDFVRELPTGQSLCDSIAEADKQRMLGRYNAGNANSVKAERSRL